MFNYLCVAIIYTIEGTSTAVVQRVSTKTECKQIGDVFKTMEENTDYKCIKLEILK